MMGFCQWGNHSQSYEDRFDDLAIEVADYMETQTAAFAVKALFFLRLHSLISGTILPNGSGENVEPGAGAVNWCT